MSDDSDDSACPRACFAPPESFGSTLETRQALRRCRELAARQALASVVQSVTAAAATSQSQR